MLKDRFRKYLPVVVDLETGGFDPLKNAILEIAITLIEEEDEQLVVGETHRYHIQPYRGLEVEDESLEFTKIKLDHPLRNAVEEEVALKELFKIINQTKRTLIPSSLAICLEIFTLNSNSILTEQRKNNFPKKLTLVFEKLTTLIARVKA